MANIDTTPVLHLNGSSQKLLMEQLRNAVDALQTAYKAVQETQPHSRDFYPRPDAIEAFAAASDAHRARLTAIQNTQTELMHIGAAIMDGGWSSQPRNGRRDWDR